MPTTGKGIYFANGSAPHELNTVSTTMANSIDGALDTAHFRSAATYGALPANDGTYVAGKTMGWTTSDRRMWVWNGTRFVLFGGTLPMGEARPSADAHPVTTTWQAFQTQNNGIIGLNGASAPAGCDGVYDWGFVGRIDNPNSNVFIRPYVAGSPVGPVDVISGGQEQIVNNGQVTLLAGQTFQVRLRTFAGTTTLQGTASKVWIAYRCPA